MTRSAWNDESCATVAGRHATGISRFGRVLLGGCLLLLVVDMGCRCPDAYFQKGEPFTLTVNGKSSTDNTCDEKLNPFPASFVAGDVVVLVGTGDRSFEAGMCDDGTLVPADDAPWYAKGVLTGCSVATGFCSGSTAAGCQVHAIASLRLKDGNRTQEILEIDWTAADCAPFPCQERYDVAIAPKVQ